MNLTFLIAGMGFVVVAGVLYYFTNKAEEEEIPRKPVQQEAPKATNTAPVHEVIKKFLIII